MALATTTTPGSVILGGDLTGVANAPELRITGVTAGSYTGVPTLVVDAKGRTIFASSMAYNVPLDGRVTGTNNNAQLAASGVTAGSYLSANITVDAAGIITAISNYSPGDASYSAKGFLQVTSGPLSITGGILAGVAATSTSYGMVKSADSANISISAGLITTGSNVPNLATTNTFTKAIKSNVISISSPVLVTPDLSNNSIFNITLPSTGSFSILAPTNYTTGAVFDFVFDFTTEPPATTSYEIWSLNMTAPGGTYLYPMSGWEGNIVWNGTAFFQTSNAYEGVAGATKLAKSTDGITWTEIAIPTPSEVDRMYIFANSYGTLVLSTNNGTYYSNDSGSNWNVATGNGAGLLTCSTGAGFFSVSSTVYNTSPDGITWTSHSSDFGTISIFNGAGQVISDGSKFVAVTNDGNNIYPSVRYSTTGANWTAAAISDYAWGSIAWNGSIFVITQGNFGWGKGDPAYGGVIVPHCMTSPDGVTWTLHANAFGSGSDGAIAGVAWDGTKFIAIATTTDHATYFTSTDGSSWIGTPISTTGKNLVCGSFASTTSQTVAVSLKQRDSNLVATLRIASSTLNANFASNYKFSNARNGSGNQTVRCVMSGSSAYCTFLR